MTPKKVKDASDNDSDEFAELFNTQLIMHNLNLTSRIVWTTIYAIQTTGCMAIHDHLRS